MLRVLFGLVWSGGSTDVGAEAGRAALSAGVEFP